MINQNRSNDNPKISSSFLVWATCWPWFLGKFQCLLSTSTASMSAPIVTLFVWRLKKLINAGNFLSVCLLDVKMSASRFYPIIAWSLEQIHLVLCAGDSHIQERLYYTKILSQRSQLGIVGRDSLITSAKQNNLSQKNKKKQTRSVIKHTKLFIAPHE